MRNIINIYKALINVRFPNHHSMNEIEFRNHALAYTRRSRDLTSFFAKLIYFRDHEIEDPLFISVDKYGLCTHPGRNRYFGSSFRPQYPCLSAYIYTENKIGIPGITWIEHIEKIKRKNLKDYIAKLEKENLKTKFDHAYAESYFRKVTNNTRLELEFENDVLIGNPTGKETLRGSVNVHKGVHNTVKYMFDQFPKNS